VYASSSLLLFLSESSLIGSLGSAGVFSTTATTAAFIVSSMAFLYAVTHAFKASFSNINSSTDSSSITPTSRFVDCKNEVRKEESCVD